MGAAGNGICDGRRLALKIRELVNGSETGPIGAGTGNACRHGLEVGEAVNCRAIELS